MYKKILIVNLGGVGDFLLSTPALRALCASNPRARVTLLAVPRVHEVASTLPYLHAVHVFHKEFRAVLRTLRTLLSLRRERYDLVINMRTLVSAHSARKMKWLLFLLRPRVSAGRDTDGRGSFFAIRVPESGLAGMHEREYDIRTAEALGAQVTDRTIDFRVTDTDAQMVRARLTQQGIGDAALLIGCHPGGEPSRRWPIERFSALIRELTQRLNPVFVITGTQEERPLAQQLVQGHTSVVDMSGQLSITQLGALIKRCRLFISNDTGPMHIAAIVHTPLVAFFGPGDLTRFDPRVLSDAAEVLHHPAACAPCNRFTCRDMRCLTMISTEEAVAAAMRLLR